MPVYLSDFDGELDVIHEYVIAMSQSLKQAHAKFSKRIGVAIARLDEADAQEFINDSAVDDIMLGDLFPALSANWTFVSIMSFLEHHLVYICREVGTAKAGKGQYEFRPRGSVLDQCKSELQNLGLAIPVGGAEWNELKKLQDVRNTIVHRLGEVEKDTRGGDDREIYRYVSGRSDVRIHFQKIVPTHDFCQHVINLVRLFLWQVAALIPTALLPPPPVRER